MYVIVVYDVSQDSRRARLSRRLDTVLRRVQKSVFEGVVPPETHAMLLLLIQRTIDPHTDTVRIYHLCGACKGRTDLLGASPTVPHHPEDVLIDR